MKRTLLTIAVALLAFPALAAVQYEYFQKSTAEGAVIPSNDLTARVVIDGLRSRVEFLSGDVYPTGTYVISTDGSRRLVFVDPAKRWYTEYNTAAVTSSLSPANVKVSNLQSKSERLADEKVIAGIPTDHYRMTLSYDITVLYRSMPLKQHVRTVIDTWTTLKFGEVSRLAFGASLQTGNPEIDQLIELETTKAAGFPMRQLVSITMSAAPANSKSELKLPTSRVITREMLVTSIQERPADPSMFAIPADFRRADLPAAPKAPAQILTLEPTGK